jgi:phage shock protein C
MTASLVTTAYRVRGPIQRWLLVRGITRTSEGRLVAGVCTGLAARLHVSPWIVRLVFGVLVLFPISSALLYVALWLILPPPVR